MRRYPTSYFPRLLAALFAGTSWAAFCLAQNERAWLLEPYVTVAQGVGWETTLYSNGVSTRGHYGAVVPGAGVIIGPRRDKPFVGLRLGVQNHLHDFVGVGALLIDARLSDSRTFSRLGAAFGWSVGTVRNEVAATGKFTFYSGLTLWERPNWRLVMQYESLRTQITLPRYGPNGVLLREDKVSQTYHSIGVGFLYNLGRAQ